VWSAPKSLMTPQSFEVTRDSTIAPLAARFHRQLEDRKVLGKKDKPYIYETRGVMFVHPDTPHLLVALEFTEWADASVPRTEAAGLDSFLLGLQLVRVDTAAVRCVDVGPKPSLVRPAHGVLWAVCLRESPDEWSRAALPPGSEQKPTASGEILRLDPSTLKILTRVRVDGWITDLAPTSDAVWASDYKNGALLRLDPATGATTATVKCGGKPVVLRATSEALWVMDKENGTIQSVDLRSLELAGKPIRDLKRPYEMVEVGDLLWIIDRATRSVASLDPKTRAFVGAPIPVAEDPMSIVYGDGSLWVACAGIDAIQRLDPVNRVMAATIPLGFTPTDLVFTRGGLWVGSWDDGRLMAVDTATNRVKHESIHASLRIAMMTASDHGLAFTDGVAGTVTLVPLP
jgi:streptogramin lyase